MSRRSRRPPYSIPPPVPRTRSSTSDAREWTAADRTFLDRYRGHRLFLLGAWLANLFGVPLVARYLATATPDPLGYAQACAVLVAAVAALIGGTTAADALRDRANAPRIDAPRIDAPRIDAPGSAIDAPGSTVEAGGVGL